MSWLTMTSSVTIFAFYVECCTDVNSIVQWWLFWSPCVDSHKKLSKHMVHNGSHDDVILMIKLISKKRERKMTGVVSSRPSKTSTKSMARSAIDVGLLLCVPFACSIGGTGTLTGTDLNLYLQGFHQDNFRTYTNGNVTWENDAKGRLPKGLTPTE